MKNFNKKNIINVDRKNPLEIAIFRQDNTNVLEVELFFDNGNIVDLTGQDVSINAIRVDDNAIFEQKTGITIDKNKVTAILLPKMCNRVGRLDIQFKIKDKKDNSVFNTSSSYVYIERNNISYNSLEEGGYIEILDQIEIEEDKRKENETQRISNENQRKENEKVRIENENRRNTQEQTRSSNEGKRVTAEQERLRIFDDIITGSQDSGISATIEAEVIGARGTNKNLKSRIDVVETKATESTEKVKILTKTVETLDVEVKGKASKTDVANSIKTESDERKAKDEELQLSITNYGSKLKGYINLEDYRKYATGLGTENEDWIGAFRRILSENTGGVIFIPPNEYKVSDTILFKEGFQLTGVKGMSAIKLTVNNKSLIDFKADNTRRNTRLKIEDICLLGIGGTGNTQIGIDVGTWWSEFNNVKVMDFNVGIKLNGVLVTFNACYIVRNGDGIRIEPQTINGKNVFSTMITFNDCLIHYNTLGIWADDEGDANGKRPIIGLYINRCAFEWNQKAFLFTAILRSVIRDSWFEQNYSRPQTYAGGIILSNNRFEFTTGKPQEIEFKPRPGQVANSGGYYEQNAENISLRYIYLQEYTGTQGVQSANLKLESKLGKMIYNDGFVNVTPKGEISDYSKLKNTKLYIYIGNTGNVLSTNIPQGQFDVTITSNNTYLVNLKANAISNPMINVTGSSAAANGGAMPSDFVQTFVRFYNSDNSMWNLYGIVNRIEIKLKNEANQVVKGNISVEILTNTKI